MKRPVSGPNNAPRLGSGFPRNSTSRSPPVCLRPGDLFAFDIGVQFLWHKTYKHSISILLLRISKCLLGGLWRGLMCVFWRTTALRQLVWFCSMLRNPCTVVKSSSIWVSYCKYCCWLTPRAVAPRIRLPRMAIQLRLAVERLDFGEASGHLLGPGDLGRQRGQVWGRQVHRDSFLCLKML